MNASWPIHQYSLNVGRNNEHSLYTVFFTFFPIIDNTVHYALAESFECLGNAFLNSASCHKVAESLEYANVCYSSLRGAFSSQISQTFSTSNNNNFLF